MGCCGSKTSVVDIGASEAGSAVTASASTSTEDMISRDKPSGRPSLAELQAQYMPPPGESSDPDAVAPGHAFLRSGLSLKKVIEKNAVLVVTRVRPPNKRETDAASPECIEVTSSSTLKVKESGGSAEKPFTFDACFRGDASQEDVYTRSGRMVLGKVLDGFNGCVLAYGQTGSGKTHTMQGSKEAPVRKRPLPDGSALFCR